jgi:chemotaxis protein methyltransferase CheR
MNLSLQHFSELSSLLKAETAIVLEPGKEYLVEARLSALAREQGFPSVGDLLTELFAKKQSRLKTSVLLALTTNETSFFRDVAPFDALKTTVIPEMISKRARSRTLTIWSAACSTGQEPYSIAMLIRENFPELAGWRVRICGSDINSLCLNKARSGEYSQLEVNRGLPATLLVKYFEKDGAYFRVKKDISTMVDFFELNLIHPWPALTADIILLRNVLIYFDTEAKKEIFNKARKVLAPDGYLFLGAAETPYRIDDRLNRVSFGKVSAYQLLPNS